MTKRIQKAIDIFLDALNKGTLAKGTCAACAVGNLVADGLKSDIALEIDKEYGVGYYTFIPTDSKSQLWGNVFFTPELGKQVNRPKENVEAICGEGAYDEAMETLAKTDFTIEELMKIEYVFEKSTFIHFTEYHHHTKDEVFKDQIRGLEAVVALMMTFDEVKEDVKEVFTDKAVNNFNKQLQIV